ncbi:DNA-processing protein DprA [Spiroplasma turonicum]|uniref:DNA processing/uptake protein n=1 Tax=Spiroplasma turonicum TaxID=216946 RepID=A0A0K1P856_9MOLU|nr:DNA-processing protein DprA [Spiroplasma turonicum]AKU80067.1 DNA processing/uptake protein [Spiroplasma turonicum]ALX71069.1 DNA processing/uptake protein [Spiroplasma turonicum]
MDNVLLYFSLKYNGDWDKIFQALESKEKIEFSILQDVKKQIRCNFITLLNPLYPSELKNSYKPPFVLYFVGNLELLSNYNKTLSIYADNETNEKYDQSINYILDYAINNDYTIIVSSESVNIKNMFFNNLESNNRFIYSIKGSISNFFIDNSLDYNDKFKNTLFISTIYNENSVIVENDSFFNNLQVNLSKFALFLNCVNTKEYINLFNYYINEGKEVLSIPEIELSSAINNNFLDLGTKILKYFK